MLLEVELAFSDFASSISLLYKLNMLYYVFFVVVVVVYYLRFLFCFGMLGLVGKRGEASGGGYLLRGVEQAG